MNSLEKRVLSLIGENVDSPDALADITPVRDSLNDAIAELCAGSNAYHRKYLFQVLQDRQFYKLTPQNDYLCWVWSVFDLYQRRPLTKTSLSILARHHPDWMDTSGRPTHYLGLAQDHVALWPIPDVEGTILEIDCLMIPHEYTSDTDPIKIHSQWHSALVNYAVAEFYGNRGDAKRSVEYFQRYLEAANMLALHPDYADRQYQWGGFDRSWNRRGNIGSPYPAN